MQDSPHSGDPQSRSRGGSRTASEDNGELSPREASVGDSARSKNGVDKPASKKNAEEVAQRNGRTGNAGDGENENDGDGGGWNWWLIFRWLILLLIILLVLYLLFGEMKRRGN